MAELKTKPNDQSVAAFLAGINDATRREECHTVAALMAGVTGAEPQMWGDAIVGFGRYRYQYASGRSGDWFLTGFAPRKQNLTLYIMGGLEQHAAILARLGKYTSGKGCLYVKRLADIELDVLRTLVKDSVAQLCNR